MSQLPHGSQYSRRQFLQALGVSAAMVGAVPLLSGCTGGAAPAGGGGSGLVTFGSGSSDDVPKAAYKAVTDAFTAASGFDVRTNTVPHNDFQNNINQYLQGSPDDAFTWFAGYRMQYYADKGLLAPIDDVWGDIGANFSEGMKKASTGPDGKMYFVPNYNYPWGYFYKKSLWEARGYEVPVTWDEFIALCKTMEADGLIPIEFADKDGWPALGTFDYLNMRVNGFEYHMALTAHEESWDSPKVQAVFDAWQEMLPYQNPAALGMTWQDAAGSMGSEKSGMYLLGSFVLQQYAGTDIEDDFGFFPFPEMAVEGQSAVEAPIDGLLLTRRGGDNENAHEFMRFIGTADGQNAYSSVDKSNISTVEGADLSYLSPVMQQCAETIANASSISQFLDRDALPALANNVVIPALQSFIKGDGIDLANIEAQAVQLYAAE